MRVVGTGKSIIPRIDGLDLCIWPAFLFHPTSGVLEHAFRGITASQLPAPFDLIIQAGIESAGDNPRATRIVQDHPLTSVGPGVGDQAALVDQCLGVLSGDLLAYRVFLDIIVIFEDCVPGLLRSHDGSKRMGSRKTGALSAFIASVGTSLLVPLESSLRGQFHSLMHRYSLTGAGAESMYPASGGCIAISPPIISRHHFQTWPPWVTRALHS